MYPTYEEWTRLLKASCSEAEECYRKWFAKVCTDGDYDRWTAEFVARTKDAFEYIDYLLHGSSDPEGILSNFYLSESVLIFETTVFRSRFLNLYDQIFHGTWHGRTVAQACLLGKCYIEVVSDQDPESRLWASGLEALSGLLSSISVPEPAIVEFYYSFLDGTRIVDQAAQHLHCECFQLTQQFCNKTLLHHNEFTKLKHTPLPSSWEAKQWNESNMQGRAARFLAISRKLDSRPGFENALCLAKGLADEVVFKIWWVHNITSYDSILVDLERYRDNLAFLERKGIRTLTSANYAEGCRIIEALSGAMDFFLETEDEILPTSSYAEVEVAYQRIVDSRTCQSAEIAVALAHLYYIVILDDSNADEYVRLGQARLRVWRKRKAISTKWGTGVEEYLDRLKNPETRGTRFWTPSIDNSDMDGAQHRFYDRTRQEAIRRQYEEEVRRLEKEIAEKERQRKMHEESIRNWRAEEERRLKEEAEYAARRRFFENAAIDLSERGDKVQNVQDLRVFLDWLKGAHPPRDGRQTFEQLIHEKTLSRRWFMKLIIIYHPDKNGHHGEEWRETCTDITKVITRMQFLTSRY
jgi:hypothetical protein